MTSQPIVSWNEIPVLDMKKAVEFYSIVFGYEMTIIDSGPNPIAVLGGSMNSSGHLYPGKPAPQGAGPTVHLVVPDTVEAASTRCKAAGGTVLTPPIEIPPGLFNPGRFAYAIDPDGNSLSLFEPKR